MSRSCLVVVPLCVFYPLFPSGRQELFLHVLQKCPALLELSLRATWSGFCADGVSPSCALLLGLCAALCFLLLLLFVFLGFFFFWLPQVLVVGGRIFNCGLWDLVPQPGIEPGPPALGAQSRNYRTAREVPTLPFGRGVCPGRPQTSGQKVFVFIKVTRAQLEDSSGLSGLGRRTRGPRTPAVPILATWRLPDACGRTVQG